MDLAIKNNMKNSSSWSEETLFNDADLFFKDVLRSIESAKRCIDIETYIFNKDQIGTRILNGLIKAAARGIEVRLLMDGVGCYDWTPDEVMQLRSQGLAVKIFHPLPWYQADSAEKLIKSIQKLERRDHRKCIIIDQEIAYCGSANITQVHSKHIMGKDAFRDTNVKVRGDNIKEIQKEFNWMWQTASPLSKEKPPVNLKEFSLVRANSSISRRKWIHKDLFRRISEAKSCVWIMTPYFVPRLSMLYAFRTATRNGVDVRILLPHKSDIGQLRRIAHSFYSTLLKHKVRIFEYTPSTLHGKVMLIDDWVTVGSTNFNYRSHIYDYELDVVLTHPKSIESIREDFIKDFSQSEEIKAAKWNSRSIFDRFMETLVLPFKNWS